MFNYYHEEYCSIDIYYTIKNSDETSIREIPFSLEDYHNSYVNEWFHDSQNYEEWQVLQEILPLKKSFVHNFIKEQFSEDEKPNYNVHSIIQELDESINNINDETEIDEDDE